jgi:L-seryl-tRNA(Ser) seleniumtransferase
MDTLAAAVTADLIARQQVSLRPLFNLTGTGLHTNLGRAPLAEAAVTAVVAAMRAPVIRSVFGDGTSRVQCREIKP